MSAVHRVDVDEPIPLRVSRSSGPFPVDALPSAVADMVDAVATATQTDPAMSGTTALSALAAAVGGLVEVEARPGWREVTGLFTLVVAEPGERKSAVQAAMVAPLLAAERELVASTAAARSEAATRADVLRRAAETARAAAGRSRTPEAEAEAVSAGQDADTAYVPPAPRIVAGDATPEAVAGLLAEQGGHLAILSAEGGLFDTAAGRYSSVPNIDVYLLGHAGDPIRVDRRGRDPEHIDRPALTVGLMVQADVLRAAGDNRAFVGRGLLHRFLYSRPESMLGRRIAGAPPVPRSVADRYAGALLNLATELRRSDSTSVLCLTPEAQDAVIELEREIEPQLDRQSGQLAPMAGWASKWIGSVLRVAGLIHMATHGFTGTLTPVTGATFKAAERIGRYYLAQAVGVYSDIGADDTTRSAVYLLDRIRAHGQTVVSERDLLRIARALRSRADLLPPMTRLIDHGWLTAVEVKPPSGPGRPGSPKYTVHPDTWRDT